jgi:hypothetical protein
MSGATYGYRYIHKTEDAPASYLVIDAEARVVQRIYDMYTVAGLSYQRDHAPAQPATYPDSPRRAHAGNARWYGLSCETRRTEAWPTLETLAWLRAAVSHDHCVCGAGCPSATAQVMSARVTNGLRSQCLRLWPQDIPTAL